MFTKRAGDGDLEKTADIMRRIHTEDPSYWPYGLDVSQFDGGLYLISKQASSEPVGFVGWQVRQENARDIGYYAIGVLPEYRQQGFAKSAVTELLREKAASVSEVRAMVCSHNQPSKNLARSVGVTLVEKVAALEKAAAMPGGASPKAQVLSALAGALGSTAFFDQTADPSRPIADSFQPWKWDKQRALMGGMNAALGALGGQQIADGNIGKGLIALTAAPAKDLMLKGQGTLYKLDAAADASRKALEAPKPTPTSSAEGVVEILKSIPKPILLGAIGLGAGGLGIAAYSAKKKMDLVQAQNEAARAGRVKVTLPTKNPGDSETMLDLPMEDIQLSNALRSRLGRDTRRRLYAETRERTARRKPKDPSAPTDKELEDEQLQEEEANLSKESRIANLLAEIRPQWYVKEAAAPAPAPAIPSPPPQGVNPAMRMTQQQATANSIQPSTEANPQIMKAQQDAANAQMQADQTKSQVEQQAAQQSAQLQQESAQAQMEQQQRFSEQLSKAKQENEVLQMKVEKAKVEGDLAKAKAKAEADISAHHAELSGSSAKGEHSAVRRLTQARMDRLQGKLSKSGAFDAYDQAQRDEAAKWGPPRHAMPSGQVGVTAGNTGLPKEAEPIRLRPNAAQKMNDNGFELISKGVLAPMNNYRASYGKVGDWLYDNLWRAPSLTPSAVRPMSNLSYSDMINNPDKIGMIENASRQAQDYMNRPIGP